MPRQLIWAALCILGCEGSVTENPRPDAAGGSDGGAVLDAATDVRADTGRDAFQPDAMDVGGGELDGLLPRLGEEECAFEVPPVSPHPSEEFRAVTVCEAGCDHATVTAAVEAAEPFDEIRLAPGEYDECIHAQVSHIAIVGDGGLAHFVDPHCPESTNAMLFDAEYVRLSDIRLTGFRRPDTDNNAVAIRLRGVAFTELKRIWIEDVDAAINVNVADADVLFDQLKVRGSGSIDDAETHQRPILAASSGGRFWMRRSVFSHFTRRAWLLGMHGVTHAELVCNVVAKPGDEEAEHSLHIFYPERMIMRRNYFHEPYGSIVLYNYDLGSDSDLILEENVFVFDEHERGNFVGIVQASTRVTAIGNTIVGGLGVGALDGPMVVDMRDNESFGSRSEAGYEAAPALPSAWPVERL